MANPKKKHTPMRTGMRRSANFRLSEPTLSLDPKTGEYHLPHHISPSGYYKGELVLPPKQKKIQKAKGLLNAYYGVKYFSNAKNYLSWSIVTFATIKRHCKNRIIPGFFKIIYGFFRIFQDFIKICVLF